MVNKRNKEASCQSSCDVFLTLYHLRRLYIYIYIYATFADMSVPKRQRNLYLFFYHNHRLDYSNSG